MRLPFVSRDRYDAATEDARRARLDADFWHHEVGNTRAEYQALLDKYHALRVQGATVTRPLPAASPAPRSPEERMVTEADAEYEANAVRALVSQGASEADARVIAKAMRADLTNLSLSVPGFDG